MTARIVADQRRLAAQRRAAQPRQALARAPVRAPAGAPRIEVKNIERGIHNRTFKIKKTACTAKSRRSKKTGRVIRIMTVRRSAIYPAEVRTYLC